MSNFVSYSLSLIAQTEFMHCGNVIKYRQADLDAKGGGGDARGVGQVYRVLQILIPRLRLCGKRQKGGGITQPRNETFTFTLYISCP